MKKPILLFSFLLAACASIIPTPNDFPPPPSTVIVEFPGTAIATHIPKLRLQPVTEEKMSDARTFFLILYTGALSGDSFGFAERVHYPIKANVNGALTTISSKDEFLAQYNQIFNSKNMDVLKTTSEEDLVYLPDGVRVGQGEIWFNLFCADAACTQKNFLITQINN
jgi:hypothetical protein